MAISWELLNHPVDYIESIDDTVDYSGDNVTREYVFHVRVPSPPIHELSDFEQDGEEVPVKGFPQPIGDVPQFLFPIMHLQREKLVDDLRVYDADGRMLHRLTGGTAGQLQTMIETLKGSDQTANADLPSSYPVLVVVAATPDSRITLRAQYRFPLSKTANDYDGQRFSEWVRENIFHLKPLNVSTPMQQLGRSAHYHLQVVVPAHHYVGYPKVLYRKAAGEATTPAPQMSVQAKESTKPDRATIDRRVREIKDAFRVIRRGLGYLVRDVRDFFMRILSRNRGLSEDAEDDGLAVSRWAHFPERLGLQGRVLAGPLTANERHFYFGASDQTVRVEKLRVNFHEHPPGTHVITTFSALLLLTLMIAVRPFVESFATTPGAAIEVATTLLLAVPSLVLVIGQVFSASTSPFAAVTLRITSTIVIALGLAASLCLLVASANHGDLPPLPLLGRIDRPTTFPTNLDAAWDIGTAVAAACLVIDLGSWRRATKTLRRSRTSGPTQATVTLAIASTTPRKEA